MVTSRVETITPDYAEQLIQKCEHQRPLSKSLVSRLQLDILQDRFVLNGEPFIIGSNGQLLDGMHRAYAIYGADRPVQSLVVRGVDPAVFATINTGKPRSFSDMIKIQNGSMGKWNLPRLAAIVASMATSGSSMGTVSATMSDMMRARILYAPALAAFEDLAFITSGSRSMQSVIVGGVVAATILDHKTTPQARAFLEAVHSGIADDPRKAGSSAITLRNWVLTNAVSGSVARGVFYRKAQRAFKAWLTGETWVKAQFPKFPIWDVSVGSEWWESQ